MSQLTYEDNQAVGFAGQLYDLGENDMVTGVSEEASAEMPFGIVVVRATTDDGVKIPAAEADIPKGVVVHSHSYQVGVDLGDTGLKPKTEMSIMRRGRIWVTVQEAVIPGDRAYIRFAGTGQKGGWRKSEVVGETMDITLQAEFQTTAAADALAVVEVDFTYY